MTQLRVAIAGAGWVARSVHLPYLLRDPAYRVVGVFDPSDAQRHSASTDFGVPALRSPDAVLGDDVDVVFVCSPPSSHAAYALAALEAGKHVVCEKPLATTGADAAAVVRRAENAASAAFCCFTSRYRADVQRMRALVRAGRIGQPRYFRGAWLRSKGVPGTQGALEAGVLWDLGSHLVDACLWATGWRDAHQVTASLTAVSDEADGTRGADWYGHSAPVTRGVGHDTATLQVGFTGDAVAQVVVSGAANVPHDTTELFIVGTTGAIRLRSVFGWSPRRAALRGPALEMCATGDATWRPLVEDHEPTRPEYVRQLDAFFARVRDGGRGIDELEVAAAGAEILATASAQVVAP